MELDYIKLKDIKTALAGYIRETQSMLKPETFPDEKVVHDVRVLMKKARAVLRLASPQLDVVFTEREKQALRDVGRLMSSWRETSVLRKCVKDLKKDHLGIFSQIADNEKLNGLMKKQKPVQEIPEDAKNGLRQIREILNKTSYRVRFEPMKKLDPQLLIKELEVTYNCVVANYLICRHNPKEASLHEFRKRSKDFLYQLWFFRPLNASVVKALEKKLDILTQNLGKYNDLAQLLCIMDYKYGNIENKPVLDELAIIIRENQDRYLSKVWPVAYKIFCPGQKLVNILGFKLLVI